MNFAAVAHFRLDAFVKPVEVNRCFGSNRDELGGFSR